MTITTKIAVLAVSLGLLGCQSHRRPDADFSRQADARDARKIRERLNAEIELAEGFLARVRESTDPKCEVRPAEVLIWANGVNNYLYQQKHNLPQDLREQSLMDVRAAALLLDPEPPCGKIGPGLELRIEALRMAIRHMEP